MERLIEQEFRGVVLDRIFVGAGYEGEDGGTIYAIYPNSTIKWKFVSSPRMAWPRLPAVNIDGSIIVSMLFSVAHNPTVYALYPENGTMKGEFVGTSESRT